MGHRAGRRALLHLSFQSSSVASLSMPRFRLAWYFVRPSEASRCVPRAYSGSSSASAPRLKRLPSCGADGQAAFLTRESRALQNTKQRCSHITCTAAALNSTALIEHGTPTPSCTAEFAA